jgi:hypothetical protein
MLSRVATGKKSTLSRFALPARCTGIARYRADPGYNASRSAGHDRTCDTRGCADFIHDGAIAIQVGRYASPCRSCIRRAAGNAATGCPWGWATIGKTVTSTNRAAAAAAAAEGCGAEEISR